MSGAACLLSNQTQFLASPGPCTPRATSKRQKEYETLQQYVKEGILTSVKNFFETRCNSQFTENPKRYWDTIKPFVTDKKVRSGSTCFTLKLGNDIINDASTVSNAFNEFFSTVADHIGTSSPLVGSETIDDIVKAYDTHESIVKIRSQINKESCFSFEAANQNQIYKLLNDTDTKKATGYDGIPPKMLKISASELCKPITNIINLSIRESCFPPQLKLAEVSPLYKKSDNLERSNHRPVSVLSCTYKVFEKVYCDQMYEYFMGILSHYLSAFRKMYGCNHVLLKLVEDWKYALDRCEHVGAILMDLSKAFDCLPHRLLFSKLHAYGVSLDACSLIRNYLQGRRQRVKINCTRSEWLPLSKGVPQGSVLGPLLFNVFINDIFYFLENKCMLYNYADDNSISYSHTDMNNLQLRLEQCAAIAVDWFTINEMEANPSKFQGIVIPHGLTTVPTSFIVASMEIPIETNVKVLGIFIDNDLNFARQIKEICSKATRQLHAIARISKYLDEKCKLSLYNAFIMSSFNYCNTIWHFCNDGDILKLEKLQKRALRIIFNDYESNYDTLLQRSGRPLLYVSRLRAVALETYKTINKQNPQFLQDLFVPKENHYGLRNGSQMIQPKVRTEKYGLNSFRYQGSKLWNSLPPDMKLAASASIFKNLLLKWYGQTCSCGFCILCKLNQL